MIPGQYDSLMAKLIVHGATREQALRRAQVALAEFTIEGVPTVLPFHRAVSKHPDFVAEQRFGVYTTWIESEFADELANSDEIATTEAGAEREVLTIDLDGKAMALGLPVALVNAIRHGGSASADSAAVQGANSDEASIVSPMAGNLVSFSAQDGESVSKGQTVAVLEAMKMESPVTAHRDGIFTSADLSAGQGVLRGDVLGRVS